MMAELDSSLTFQQLNDLKPHPLQPRSLVMDDLLGSAGSPLHDSTLEARPGLPTKVTIPLEGYLSLPEYTGETEHPALPHTD
jgi:hypothetical protein